MSSNASAQESLAFCPNFSSTRTTLKPGVALSTTKQDMPFLPASGSVMAKSTVVLPIRADEMNCLAPLTV